MGESAQEAGASISDQQLADACCPGEPQTDKDAFLAALGDKERATLKRLIWTAEELNAGRRPQGVIVCKR